MFGIENSRGALGESYTQDPYPPYRASSSCTFVTYTAISLFAPFIRLFVDSCTKLLRSLHRGLYVINNAVRQSFFCRSSAFALSLSLPLFRSNKLDCIRFTSDSLWWNETYSCFAIETSPSIYFLPLTAIVISPFLFTCVRCKNIGIWECAAALWIWILVSMGSSALARIRYHLNSSQIESSFSSLKVK